MEMAKISPEAPDAGGVHSTADDRTLIKNGCTAWYWAQVPSPAPAPFPARRDCLPALYMARQNRKRNGLPKGKTGRERDGGREGVLKNRRTGFTGASANLCAHAQRSCSLLGSPIINWGSHFEFKHVHTQILTHTCTGSERESGTASATRETISERASEREVLSLNQR